MNLLYEKKMTIWSVHVLNVSDNANSILDNKIAHFREKYRIQHDFSYLICIKQLEQVYVMSGEGKSLIGRVWSLILVKSNQYTVEGLISIKLIICSVLL